MIKLVATDMDGTLLNSKKELPSDFFDWVINHKDIKMVIASGRQYFSLLHEFAPIKDELLFIAENGGVVFDKGEIIYVDRMSIEDLTRVLKVIDGIKEATPILCGTKAAYIKNPDEEHRNTAKVYYTNLVECDNLYDVLEKDIIVKIAVNFPQNTAEKYISKLSSLSDLGVVLSAVSWIDISNKTESKGSALKAIMDRYNIDSKECMAFGDYLNDYDLLLACEESYCMENGHEELKKIAKYIAKSNDEDGVMKVLNEIR